MYTYMQNAQPEDHAAGNVGCRTLLLLSQDDRMKRRKKRNGHDGSLGFSFFSKVLDGRA